MDDDPDSVFLSKTTLNEGEIGLMPDTGAHDDLSGSIWARAQATSAIEAGFQPSQLQMAKPKVISGVGHGSQKAEFELTLPIGITDTHGQSFVEQFVAPCVGESALPGLMGIRSLKDNDALMRCKTGEIWFLGPGGVKIEPSPGLSLIHICRCRRRG